MSTTHELFNVRTPADALSILLRALDACSRTEEVETAEAMDRVLAEDITAPSHLPTFRRSTMDGFAVRAADTFGATEGLPAYLEIVDEVLMGHPAARRLATSECARIATGGMLPDGSDAVVMVEHTQQVGPTTIEALRAVAPGENVVQIGEDVRTGDPILSRGHRLRAQDIGGLMALGATSVRVAQRLNVGIISGGDELVSPVETPGPAQIRDINSYTLAALIRRDGHAPRVFGLVPDDYARVAACARSALAVSDVLILSAGSSVSTRDMTAQVIAELGEPGVLVHGVSLKPGKPTILGVADAKPVFGLPGNPVSCMVTYDLFVAPTLAHLIGARAVPRRSVTARLTRNIASATGREDYIQVRLDRAADGGIEAIPVFGKSNLVFSLIRADGMLKVPLDAGGLSAGSTVEVVLF
ncbi:MAG: molybdopterin molybdotransferase MoeA [Actinobacteria bacterium]|nr:molybdopterin molybdotransferase MoeA [Actinomycetota bacterium]